MKPFLKKAPKGNGSGTRADARKRRRKKDQSAIGVVGVIRVQ